MPATPKPPLIDIRPDHWAIVRTILQKHVPQYEVWAFGSRAKWSAKEYSDLDLAVIADKPLSLSVSAALADDFSESDLPWKVDVVDWATTSESFREIIERDKVVVQRGGRDGVMPLNKRPFGDLFAEPTRNGLTRPKAVRGVGTKMVNMGELFAFPRLRNAPMDRVPLTDEEAQKSLLQDGDLLFARQSLVLEGAGKCSIFLGDDEPVTFESHITRVRLDAKDADPQFYFYYFQSPHGRAAIRSIVEQGAGAAGIRGSDLKTLEVEWRDVDEQSEAAAVLGTLDDKIELNRRMNETLEVIARAIFKSWFVDFDPVRAKASGEAPESICRRLGLTPDLLAFFPDRLVDSELGEIPEGWAVSPLSKVCTRITDGSHSSPKSVEEGRPMASVKDMENWGFQLSGCRRISEIDYQELSRNDCRPLANDVLIAKDGSYLKHIFVVERDLDVVILSSIAILRPNENIVPHYLAFILKSDTTLARMEQYVSGAVLQRIVLKAFREFPIVLPPRVVQDAWDQLVEPLIQRCWRNVGQNSALAEMRDALLPKLLSGELRVSEADSNIEACA